MSQAPGVVDDQLDVRLRRSEGRKVAAREMLAA